MSTQRKISDYLHLYLGCECLMTKNSYHAVHELHLSSNEPFGLTGKLLHYFIEPTTKAEIKPILRPLSDMTEEEMQECGNMEYDFSDDPDLNKWEPKDFEIGLSPRQFAWLLSKHFDLFDLIPDGLALDKSTLLNKHP
jgi:hypothetical protein